ncbi:MAG: 50S ribosomal protein L23 [Nitrospirae bacterium]|nr:50S ribosomal protein L23 [Nitrospirota bacterium]
MSDMHSILLKPLFTEKGINLKEKENKVVLQVKYDANKSEIKKAVENIFKVKVTDVNTLRVLGKKKRLGKFTGKRPDWKKAVVTLKKGEKLDLAEGM